MMNHSIVLMLSAFVGFAFGGLNIHTGRQAYRVRGGFVCGDQPAAHIRVKLIDTDTGPNPDDLLEAGDTDSSGRYDLQGTTIEGTAIDPHLYVYHDCNDGIMPCQRRWKFELPDKYISNGDTAENTLDMGTWNLEAIVPDEEHDCIH